MAGRSAKPPPAAEALRRPAFKEKQKPLNPWGPQDFGLLTLLLILLMLMNDLANGTPGFRWAQIILDLLFISLKYFYPIFLFEKNLRQLLTLKDTI